MSIKSVIYNWVHKETKCKPEITVEFISQLLVNEGVKKVHADRIAAKVMENF